MKMEVIVQRFMKSANNGKQDARGTILGSLSVAQTELPLSEAARSGRLSHGGLQALANGIAPVQAIPTVTATMALLNTDSAGGRSLLFDLIGFFLASGTPAAGATLLAALSDGPVAATPLPAQATGWNMYPARGLNAKSVARWVAALTIPSTTIWHALQSTQQLAAANAGQGDMPQEVRGGLIVPPGYAACFAILSGLGTTPLYGLSARVAEMELDLEP